MVAVITTTAAMATAMVATDASPQRMRVDRP